MTGGGHPPGPVTVRVTRCRIEVHTTDRTGGGATGRGGERGALPAVRRGEPRRGEVLPGVRRCSPGGPNVPRVRLIAATPHQVLQRMRLKPRCSRLTNPPPHSPT